ncbi:hypothetical protein BU24DRAFT_427799 [Aaosphaeria arxii CBS 175.79]|uniref:Uncharacterized protein n=1 Tax=Aaosphaeria arxii CBS 175.79 TaxID=1450172 RepID=A0A6A5XCK1_9PLEO|nr:uncharacterized protein BU24DRAFT_427799 [Aaosphaeria arxii CBS 175.79]KAF2010698.1 hypothetical protein BU24DRAFT_427799 [Aaosphaeria arxii CBS 175.79]
MSSRTRREKGSVQIRSSVDFWYGRVALRATAAACYFKNVATIYAYLLPGLNYLFLCADFC